MHEPCMMPDTTNKNDVSFQGEPYKVVQVVVLQGTITP